jgi:dTDP-4-dehydrorhamnose 3,5-epimerase
MGPDQAVFVPRGVANGYQALADDTTYSYLVNDHWSPQARASYTYLNLADETVAIAWPIPLSGGDHLRRRRRAPPAGRRDPDATPAAPSSWAPTASSAVPSRRCTPTRSPSICPTWI